MNSVEHGHPLKRISIGPSLTEFHWVQSLVRWGNLLGRGAIDLCFPPTCVFCQGALWGNESIEDAPGELCRECAKLLTLDSQAALCGRCGTLIPEFPQYFVTSGGTGMSDGERVDGQRGLLRVCQTCETVPSQLERVFVLGMYRACLREAVIAAKRAAFAPLTLALGELLGARVRRELAPHSIDLVTYVPSHWSRRLQRGGSPTQSLARRVAGQLQVPAYPLLRVVRRTAKQGMLSDDERRTNVLGAFSARKGYALQGRRVLLVDDVWTTGSTLQEAARVIREHYDVDVYAAVVARAVGAHPKSAK